MAYAILEISLHLWGQSYYSVNLRFFSSQFEFEKGSEVVGLPLSNLARERLLLNINNLPEYGQLLGNALFGSPEAQEVLRTAHDKAVDLNVPLQIQLSLSPSMPFLHDIRWEILSDPVY